MKKKDWLDRESEKLYSTMTKSRIAYVQESRRKLPWRDSLVIRFCTAHDVAYLRAGDLQVSWLVCKTRSDLS